MNQNIKNLYKKFLYGEISPDQFMEMRHFINETEDDSLRETMHEEWDENILQDNLDDELRDSIRKRMSIYVEFDKKKVRRVRLLRVAAIALPLMVMASVLMSVLFSREEQGSMYVSVERGNKAMVRLPDDTRVWLNANSSLEYDKNDKKVRSVKLIGEAFFKVNEDRDKPFIVKMNELNVVVVGTSFNAKAREYSDVIETSLVEGSIKLSSDELSQDYVLKPNEKALFNKKTNTIQIMHTDNELETAWIHNKLKFSSERFADVLMRLEDWYGVKIINNCPDIDNDLISGTFREEKIENALQSIKLQYQSINFLRQKDTIIIFRN